MSNGPRFKVPLAVVSAALGTACGAPHSQAEHGGHNHGHAHHAFADAESLSRTLDDPARDAWQQPDEVLRAMDLTPSMRVADVGSGTGYFAVRLARALPSGEVTATDLEPSMVRFVEERAQREGLTNVRSILATPSNAGLLREGFDRILVVHVWHHLPGRIALARELAAALRPGGRLFVVDFSVTAHRGPPPGMRLPPEAIIADLEAAGLSARLSTTVISDQYIVEGRRQP